jgi:two-component system cell cycle response regulator
MVLYAKNTEGVTGRMKKRILVLDDDEVMRSLLKRKLHFPNCEIDTASRARDAMLLAKTVRYDVIITDFHLSDIKEAELVRELKKVCPKVPMIVMSGGFAGNGEKLSHLGVYRFFEKPLNLGELRNLVEKLLFEKK